MELYAACWGDEKCVNGNPNNAFCNVPSELSRTLNPSWTVHRGSWFIDDAYTWRQSAFSTFNEYEAILTSKQWYNGDRPLLIDYMFSIDFSGQTGISSGIRIYNEATGSFCDYYFIGIGNDVIDGIYITLDRTDSIPSVINVGYKRWSETSLQSFVDGQFYTLSIKISNGDTFSVFK